MNLITLPRAHFSFRLFSTHRSFCVSEFNHMQLCPYDHVDAIMHNHCWHLYKCSPERQTYHAAAKSTRSRLLQRQLTSAVMFVGLPPPRVNDRSDDRMRTTTLLMCCCLERGNVLLHSLSQWHVSLQLLSFRFFHSHSFLSASRNTLMAHSFTHMTNRNLIHLIHDDKACICICLLLSPQPTFQTGMNEPVHSSVLLNPYSQY